MVTLANGAPIRNKAAENANYIQLELMMLKTIPTNPITAAIIPPGMPIGQRSFLFIL